MNEDIAEITNGINNINIDNNINNNINQVIDPENINNNINNSDRINEDLDKILKTVPKLKKWINKNKSKLTKDLLERLKKKEEEKKKPRKGIINILNKKLKIKNNNNRRNISNINDNINQPVLVNDNINQVINPVSIEKEDNIKLEDINYFTISDKYENDSFNKKRELILKEIINKKINNNYYNDDRWIKLRYSLIEYLKILCKKNNIVNFNFNCISCENKAGRGNHYDFSLTINEIIHNVEFKFNTKSVNETPQFVSPMNPSKFLDKNFEEYFYDNYLPKIAEHGRLKLPNRIEYLKQNKSNNVPCLKDFKNLYDTNTDFNNYCKKIDKESIKKFIENATIDKEKMSNYLLETQKDKVYMCYKDNIFYYDEVDKNLYQIEKLIDKDNTNFIFETLGEMKIEIKLRFKNGCGLQFPAFQIKRKINKKELELICKKNNIKPPKLKDDICELLDQMNIKY